MAPKQKSEAGGGSSRRPTVDGRVVSDEIKSPNSGQERRRFVPVPYSLIRPKMMTVSAIIFGLLPIMWSAGAGY